MPLSWNEIKHRAIQFSRDWREENHKKAEAKTFWDEFFQVFGIPRKTVKAVFETPVRTLKGSYGFIDLFWPGRLVVEHKSAGLDLGKAQSQAFEYIEHLFREERGDEVPRHVIVSDFRRIALFDLESDAASDAPSLLISITELYKHVEEFAFIVPGASRQRFEREDPVNLQAVDIMGRLHDALEDGGCGGHELERILVRVLFCLFADDTGIFPNHVFKRALEETREDGSDVGPLLERLFHLLNMPDRPEHLERAWQDLPHVNGGLFEERLRITEWSANMRKALLAAARFDWSRIKPAIFGALFQVVMEPRERRQIGAHYTSERDIMKMLRSLFLDALCEEFRRTRRNRRELLRFHERLASLRFLDPACGCGNFLVLAYRELRKLEKEVLHALADGQKVTDIRHLCRVDVDQFYGIEIKEWPARIAEVSLWLIDHQMNLELSEAFGQYFTRLPLVKSPTIVHGNALRLDWETILPRRECSYVLGNPPFVGKQHMTGPQAEDMKWVAGHVKGSGLLDYVTAWYFKAADYVAGAPIGVAFVSTNSIVQGEQVGILWNELFRRGMKIHFAHRAFAWESEAGGKAHVHVVIIGFGAGDRRPKVIHEYGESNGDPISVEVENISPYLVEGNDVVVESRSAPLCDVPEIVFGNMPNDGGHLLLSPQERRELLAEEPEARRFLRRFMGSEEFINGIERWCLWLVDVPPAELRRLRKVQERVEGVRKHRLESRRDITRQLAAQPALFGEIRQPDRQYLLIPSVSSEKRRYIPMDFMRRSVVTSNAVLMVPAATKYHFGVLSSAMHMAWLRHVGGRLELRYRYSNRLVYNNFPWPQDPPARRRAGVERCAQRVLEVRKQYAANSFADLYDPLFMPVDLAKAHHALDLAVDRCYRSQPFTSERQRMECLFALYEKLTRPLTPPHRPARRKGNPLPLFF